MPKLSLLVLLLAVSYVFACSGPTITNTVSVGGSGSDATSNNIADVSGLTPNTAVVVNPGTPATVSGPVTAGDLTLQDGSSLVVSDNLNLAGVLTMSGSQTTMELQNGGTVTAAAGIVVSPAGAKRQAADSNTATITFDQGAVVSTPLVNLTEGDLEVSGGGAFTAGGIYFNCEAEANAITFTNMAVLADGYTSLQTAGSSKVVLNGGQMTSTDNLNLDGTLELDNGATVSAPTLAVATLSFQSNSVYTLQAPVTSEAFVVAKGAQVTLSSGTNSLGEVTVTGSTLNVPATVTVDSYTDDSTSNLVLNGDAKVVATSATLSGKVTVQLANGADFPDQVEVLDFTNLSGKFSSVTVVSGSQSQVYSVSYSNNRVMATKGSVGSSSKVVAGAAIVALCLSLF